MSFYRSLFAAVAAIAIASPVFADDTATTQGASNESNVQLSDNSSSQTSSTTASDSQSQKKVNLNTASAKELMKVKGLNASKARAIIAYRKKNGDFKSTADIANVKGFKKLSTDALQTIEDQLTIE